MYTDEVAGIREALDHDRLTPLARTALNAALQRSQDAESLMLAAFGGGECTAEGAGPDVLDEGIAWNNLNQEEIMSAGWFLVGLLGVLVERAGHAWSRLRRMGGRSKPRSS